MAIKLLDRLIPSRREQCRAAARVGAAAGQRGEHLRAVRLLNSAGQYSDYRGRP